MKPERAFIAERAAAQHCAELLGASAPATADLMPRLVQIGHAFAKALAPQLAPFTGGEVPQITAGTAHQGDELTFGAEIGALAANCLLAAGPAEVPLLLSFHAGAVLGMVDRTFGGRGRAPDPLPERLPLSAELMVGKLEALARAALAPALGLTGEDAISPLRRDGSFTALEPFPPGAPLAMLRIEVTEPGQAAWPIFIALAEAHLPALLGDKPAAPVRVRGRADPASEPFAALPLELRAVLVDMALPMATLAALEPGMVLPVAVARKVPLLVGGRRFAAGTVGAADDRVAIRITETFR